MGLARKIRKKYSPPPHPWQAERIEEERKIIKSYGLKNKKEIWKIASVLKGFKDQAKKLTARTGKQAEKEKKLLIEKLNKIGLLQKDATMENILDISLRDLLNRRLQSILVSGRLAKTMSQARQFITHGHITIECKKINVPSYIVSTQEEPVISFSPTSKLNDNEHPERATTKKKEEKSEYKKIETSPEAEKEKAKQIENPTPTAQN